MMNLRGRKSLSRENTPEQAEAAATATEPDDDIGEIQAETGRCYL